MSSSSNDVDVPVFLQPVMEQSPSVASTSAPASTQLASRKRGFKTLRIQPNDEETGRMHASVPAAVTASMERFVEHLLHDSVRALTASGPTKTIQPQHIKLAVQCSPSLRFLVPLFENVADVKNSKKIIDVLHPAKNTLGTNASPTPATQEQPARAMHKRRRADVVSVTTDCARIQECAGLAQHERASVDNKRGRNEQLIT